MANKLTHIQDKKLQPYDITSQQARLLVVIDGYLQKKSPLCQKELEQIMQLKGSSITSLIQHLEKKGFIHRKAGDGDARTKRLYLTEKGTDIIAIMNQLTAETEALLMATLSEEEKAQLCKIMGKIYHTLC